MIVWTLKCKVQYRGPDGLDGLYGRFSFRLNEEDSMRFSVSSRGRLKYGRLMLQLQSVMKRFNFFWIWAKHSVEGRAFEIFT